MYYQVVARSSDPSGSWEYYPYWAPVREKAAAERLAGYAAQSGCEAAILQSVTSEMLEKIGCRVVKRQETDLLPALRYLPGLPMGQARDRQQRGIEMTFQPTRALDPYMEGVDKAELDARRLNAELGAGGDILAQGSARRAPSLPLRMDILSAWLRLREKVTSGAAGGDNDGAAEDGANIGEQ